MCALAHAHKNNFGMTQSSWFAHDIFIIFCYNLSAQI